MEITEATFEDVRRENPELVKSIVETVKKEIQESDEAVAKDKDLKESKEKLATFEQEKKLSTQKELVESILKEKKDLPDVTKSRISAQINKELFESEETLKEALATEIKSELEYLNQFSKKGKINLGGGAGDDPKDGLTESLGKQFDSQMGIEEKKKDKDEDEE